MTILTEVCSSFLHYIGLCHIEMHYTHLVMIIIGHALFYFFAKYTVFKTIYRYDDTKRYASVNALIMLNISSFLLWSYAEVYHDYEHLKVVSIVSVIYLSNFAFHILSYFNTKFYGKSDEYKQEVVNPLKKQKLKKLFMDKIDSSSDERVVLDKEFYYVKSEKKFFRNVKTNLPSKTSKLIDIAIFVLVFIIAISLLVPLIEELNTFLNNSFALPILAFVFVYVLGPLYPNLYGSFLLIKNDHINMGDFVILKEKGIKGRIIEISMHWVKLKDHTRNTILTIPASFFQTEMIELISRYQSNHGKKEVLEYVVGFELYQSDNGENLRNILTEILNLLDKNIKNVSKGDSHNFWLIPDDNGVRIVLWYYVTDIEREEKIRLQVQDFILVKCNENAVDLRTPKLIQLVPNQWFIIKNGGCKKEVLCKQASFFPPFFHFINKFLLFIGKKKWKFFATLYSIWINTGDSKIPAIIMNINVNASANNPSMTNILIIA